MSLQDDVQLLKALSLLRSARTQQDLFVSARIAGARD
jgi:hypothetical protein